MLESLSLSGTQLCDLPDTITSLTHLKWLSLSDNPWLLLSSEQRHWIEALKISGCKVLL